ncbi:BBP7 family outer membrane beta-barrel protein [Bythopirellula polymerisocia]|uniref:Uncharacterized protein n=1 Tax=Bythopirellula polymerisocia TaxID=2528003 RepID=A0A5C6CSZ2_9BACT|nr:BBP7 family outer membrane beta-barrel protein [Bythopirellula polymerisocia]TWU28063.1 hypothetical protein Pla144_13500 [Bythopirellula polymerisocia]
MKCFSAKRRFSARLELARSVWGLALAVLAIGQVDAQQYRLPGSNNYPPGGQMMQGQMGMGQMGMGQMGLGQMAQRPMPQNGPIQQASMPVNMASPLAGGPAAAQGNQFTDVYGNPIVMQTSYCPSGPEGCYGDCPGGMGGMGGGGYGDPMAVDFGGYTEDQIGPHYFDFSFGAVFLQTDDLMAGVGPLGSITAGPAAPRILDPSSDLGDYDAGWQVAIRYDLGPLSLFEATYMGLYDMGYTDTVNSNQATTNPPNQPNQLFTVFSNFGVPFPIDGLDDAENLTADYQSDLQSTELSYRRYWVGNSSRLSGTYLLGFRYVRMTEQFNFDSEALLGNTSLSWGGGNDILGFQFGGDGWYGLRQGLRIGLDGKAGVYNNRYDFTAIGNFADIGNSPDDYNLSTSGDNLAFVGEFGVNMVMDLLPSWSLTAGYKVLYMDNLAIVGPNIDTTNFVPATFFVEDDLLYHGFNVGTEYVW